MQQIIKKMYLFFLAGFFVYPQNVLAQSFQVNEGVFTQITNALKEVYNFAAPIAILLIILYLLYGAFQFATSGANQEKRQEAKEMLLYGAVGLIIISSLLGLVSLVLDAINVSGGGMPDVPQLDSSGNL